MAQGKEWTTEEKDSIIQSLKPYLEMGFSRNRACSLIGLPPQTLSNWVVNNEALGMKLQGWENTINALAISNVKQAIEKEGEMDGDIRKENSWKWLERKMKDEFSPKTETDLNIKELPKPILGGLTNEDKRTDS